MNKGNSNSSNTKKPFSSPQELLREASRESVNTLKKELVDPFPAEIARQLFARREKSFSGEIMPGEAVEMREVYSGKAQKDQLLQKQLILERRLRHEDQVLIERRTNELRIQVKAIHEEVVKLAQVTPQLAKEVQVAAFQVPVEPSSYELFFLQRIFEFIKSFRKKIEDAGVWLASANRRARRKNVWGQHYKKYGAKYLLSGEHYLQRSAG